MTTPQPSAGIRFGKGVVKIVDSFVNLTVLAIFLLLLIYGSYAMWDSNRLYQSASRTEYAMYKPTSEDAGLSFDELKGLNPDVNAWLTVYGTNIDYPVTHTDNNEKYINLNAFGEFALTGSLFLDYSNQPNFQDLNNIIYGHHMDKEAMFGEIANFLDIDFFTAHQYGNLYCEGENYGIEFYAFLEADAYDSTVYFPQIWNGDNVGYRENLIDKSTHYRNINVSAEDRIVLLSTCTSTSTNGRHILIGKITDNIFADPFYVSSGSEGNQVTGVDAQTPGGLLDLVPWWAWAIIGLLLLLIILYIIITNINKGKRKHEKADNYKT